MDIEKIKEYCKEEKPCSVCQIIYDACEHKTTIQINNYTEECVFCHVYFMTAADTNDNGV